MFAAMMKQAYCLGDHSRCARDWVQAAGFEVPGDLMPNERERALRMVVRHKYEPGTLVPGVEPTIQKPTL